MKTVKKTLLRDSKTARWAALAVVAFTMLCGYFLSDVLAPLQTMLEAEKGWSASDFGTFWSAYGWFNVFLLMLIIGGLVLDKFGVRITGLGASSLMVAGTAIKYWAISSVFPDGAVILGLKAQVFWACMGYAVFCVGVEVAGITVTKIIVKWFKGKELALAMGLQLATARLGTLLALAITPFVAKHFQSVSAPILLSLILLCIGLISFVVYCFMDKKLDAEDLSAASRSAEEQFKVSDIMFILKNKGFWLIALLCVLFYSAVFPYLKFASGLMVNKFGIDEELAGLIPSVLPLGTLFLTPLFGNLYDRRGKGASIMILGALLLIAVHALFTVPLITNWIVALVLVIILGIAFSLVPSAMWPSVPKIIPDKQLGTAFSLIFWIQNWGLMGVPMLIGWVLETCCKTGTMPTADGATRTVYDYTLPMAIFMTLGILALIFAFWLKYEDRKKGYGLELPNRTS
ncbi:MAG: MFS transporter [Prevotellaceae bacterium]|jgi:MFS family permease|nr:MFS transporter [Prevotellaceae bacterium]